MNLKSTNRLWTFWIKRMSRMLYFRMLYFRSYGLQSPGYLKSLVSEHPLTINMLKDPKHCMTAFLSNFSITLSEILSLKMSLLIISKILGLFVNIMTVDEKYSLHNSEDLWQSIQQQLSKKQKTTFWILNISKKNMNLIAYELPKLWTSFQVLNARSI